MSLAWSLPPENRLVIVLVSRISVVSGRLFLIYGCFIDNKMLILKSTGKNLSMRLEEYINQKGLTFRKFGALVGVNGSHVFNIAKGKKNPSLPLAKRIENVTKGKVSIAELFSDKALSNYQKSKGKK
jgi:DNA-binding XRE family transcriptional regulator